MLSALMRLDLSSDQLARLYRRAWDHLRRRTGPHSDPYGWDAPTLRVLYPEWYWTIRWIGQAYHSTRELEEIRCHAANSRSGDWSS